VNRITVIGIGYKPLNKRTQEIMEGARVILATTRLLTVFQGYDLFDRVKEKVLVIDSVERTMEYLKTALSQESLLPVVVLASGDPMFSGIGSRIVRELGKEPVEVIPDLSSIQVAFSRIKEPWEEAFLVSLHGGPDPKKRRRLPYEIGHIPRLIRHHQRIAILTDRENNPQAIAATLPPDVLVYVFEKLGYDDERITQGTPREIAARIFADPNLVIIKRIGDSDSDQRIPFGLTETEISHSRGLITKDEVRAITLHALRLPARGIFWDIGAGSGSISIEAARLCPELTVYAIENEKEQADHIEANKMRFDAANVNVVRGLAPRALITLPRPDRVFIGGNRGKLNDIIDVVADTPAKIVVANAVTLKTLSAVLEGLEKKSFLTTVTGVSVWRTRVLAGAKQARALNPVFIVKGEKPV